MIKRSTLKKTKKKIKKTGLIKKLLLKRGAGKGYYEGDNRFFYDDVIAIIPADNIKNEKYNEACDGKEFTELGKDGKWKLITEDESGNKKKLECSDFAEFIESLNDKFPNGVPARKIYDEDIYEMGSLILSGKNINEKLKTFCQHHNELQSCKNNGSISKHTIEDNSAAVWGTDEGQKILVNMKNVAAYLVTARFLAEKSAYGFFESASEWTERIVPVVTYLDISNDFLEKVKNIPFPDEGLPCCECPYTLNDYIIIMKDYVENKRLTKKWSSDIEEKWDFFCGDTQTWKNFLIRFVNKYGKTNYKEDETKQYDEEYKTYIEKNIDVILSGWNEGDDKYFEKLAQFLFVNDDEIKFESKSNGGKKKRKTNSDKRTRKHRGIVQTGGNKGRLRKGYRYSGKRLKSGLPQIIKCKNVK